MNSKPTYKELEEELAFLKISNNLIEKSPIVKFLWKNQETWPVEYVSENVKNIFGYTADDFLSEKIVYSEIIYPEDLKRVENEVSSQSKTGFHSIEHESYRIITKAGEIKWLNDITLIRRNENNEITHFEGIIIDITKQKETEKALTESETNLRALFNAMTDAVFELDYDGKYINIAPTSPELLFKPSEDLIGKTLHEILPKPDADKVLNVLRRCLDENKTITIDYSLIIKNKTIWFEGRVAPKTKSSVLFVAHNITKRKQSENALRENEGKFKSYIENAPDGIFIANEKGEYLEVNQAACRISEYTETELLELTIPELLQQEYLEKAKNHLQTVIKDGFAKGELGYVTKSGEKRFWNVDAVKLSDTRFLGFAKDITERKQMEDALKKEHEFSQNILDTAQAIILTLDVNGKIINFNPFMERLTGYNLEEVKGKDWFTTFLVESDSNKIRNLFKTATNDTQTQGNVNAIISKDGRKIFIEWYDNALKDNAGNIIGLLCLGLDITERKKNEEALKASEENYRLLTEIMKDVVVKISTTGKILYVSPAIEKFGGYNPEEEIGSDISKYFANKTDLQRAIKILADVVHTPTSGNFEFLFQTKNKSAFPVEHTYVPLIKSGKVYAIQMVLRDITERKDAEETIKNKNIRFQKTLDAIDAAVYVADMQTYELLFLNKYAKQNWDGEIGSKCYSVLQKGRTKPCEFCTNLLLLDENGKPKEPHVWEFQNTITKQWYQLRDQAIKWTDDRLVRIEIATDITEQKKTEEALKESNKTKDKFFSIIAHDLRGPLGNITALSEMMVNKDIGKCNPESVKKMFEMIHKSSERTFGLLENLLEWSRIQTGRIVFNPVKINSQDLIEEAIAVAEINASKKNIQISVITDKYFVVYADVHMISTVIRNLLSNAIKFTPDGGSVKVNCTRALNEKGEKIIKIVVSDTGIGMRPENINNLFKIEESKSSPGTAGEKGSGLGLILCKEFVEKHGGKIWVESEIDKGSTFYFTIPNKAPMIFI